MNFHQIILLFVDNIFVIEKNPQQEIVNTTQEHLVERLLRAILPVVPGDVHSLHFIPEVQLPGYLSEDMREKNLLTWTQVG